jgi:ketosteroid isomerase-like protein
MATDAPGEHEHVRIVQSLYNAFTRGAVDEIVPLLSADVVWSEPDNPYNPAAGTRLGLSGFLEWLRIGRDAEDILVLEPKQFLASADLVVVIGHSTCRARATGRIYDTDFVHVVAFESGRVVRFQEFFDTYAASEAFRP